MSDPNAAEQVDFYTACRQICDICPVTGKSPATIRAVGHVTMEHERRGVNDIGGTVYELKGTLEELSAPPEDLAAAVAAVAFNDGGLCPNA